MIDESGIAGDRSILAAAGEQGGWVVYPSSGEFLKSSTGEYQSSRLNAGEVRLRVFSLEGSIFGDFTGEFKIFLPRTLWGEGSIVWFRWG